MLSPGWESPPERLWLAEGEVHIWRAQLDAGAATLRACESLLSADELDRARRFVFARDRRRFVAARGILRSLLGRYVGAPPAQVQFAYSPQGKPRLLSPLSSPPLCFNLAHSGDLALYALVYGRRVGVDVELVRPEAPYLSLARDVCSPAEQAVLAALPAEEGRLAFFTAWVRKEACVKALGEGLSYPLNQVEVGLMPGQAPRLRLPRTSEEIPWALHALDAGPGYTAAAVTEGPATVSLYEAPLPASS